MLDRPIRIPVLRGPGRGHRLPLPRFGLRRAFVLALGRYEQEVARFLAHSLQGRAVFFDVGASTGYFVRLAIRTMPPDGTIVAFEPDPLARGELEQLRAQAATGTFLVRDEALARGDGQASLVSRDLVCGRLEGVGVALAGASGRSIPVRTRSVDSLVTGGELPSPDVVKIDAEGAERDILEGMTRVLTEQSPAVAVECHSMALFADVLRAFVDAGYEQIRCSAGGDGVGPPTVFARRTG